MRIGDSVANDIDTYKGGKRIKKADESKIDLKNPEELEKYQKLIALESKKNNPVDVYQKGNRRIRTYQPHYPQPSKSIPEPNITRPTTTMAPPKSTDKKESQFLKYKILIAILLIVIIALIIIFR